jgi:hypothetical protein
LSCRFGFYRDGFLFSDAIAFVGLRNFPFALWLDALSMSE